MVRFHPQWRRVRELLRAGAIGDALAIQTLFTYRLLDPGNVRNRPPGGGALYDIGCYAILTARYAFGAEPVAGRRDSRHRPEFRHRQARRRHPRISRRPASDLHHRHPIGGRAARHHRGHGGTAIEVKVPFNAPPDRACEIVIDSGADLFGGGARVESFPAVDQYTKQAEAFARAARGEAEWEFPIEDALANMKAIDACFRAAKSGRWETV